MLACCSAAAAAAAAGANLHVPEAPSVAKGCSRLLSLSHKRSHRGSSIAAAARMLVLLLFSYD
jgi:hypothetical protein